MLLTHWISYEIGHSDSNSILYKCLAVGIHSLILGSSGIRRCESSSRSV